VRAAVTIDEGLDAAAAVERAGAAAQAALGGRVDLAIAFVSTAHGPAGTGLLRCSRGLAGAELGLLARIEGLLSRHGEHVGTPVVGVVALQTAGVRAEHHVFEHARGREAELGDELAATFDGLAANDLVLVIADARELDPRALAGGLGPCAPAGLLGIGVEGSSGGSTVCAVDGEPFEAGALALRLSAPSSVQCALAAPAAIGPVHTVTGARGHWLLELDGVAALEEFRDAAGALWDDERRAMRSVLVALPEQAGGAPEPALVRTVVGIDVERGAIALPEPVEAGQRLAFARRDPLIAREALAAAAARLEPTRGDSGIGLAASCRLRGEALFGHAGIESGYLARAFDPAPWLGLVGSYQIAGACGLPGRLLTHTAALVRLV
jgi:small ligand-binding sensory domain FIST